MWLYEQLKKSCMVKRFIYLFFLLMLGLNSMAQRQVVKNLTTFDDKRLHFGFSLGLNALDFGIQQHSSSGGDKIRADISTLTPGFTVGIITNLRLTESLDLRFLPGMSFGERILTYNIPVVSTSGTSDHYSIKSTFLDFPLLVKYKARRMNNQRPYLIGGIACRYDINKSGKDDLVRLKPFSTSIEAGMGWDSYLQFFRLSTELKFSFGLTNILGDGPVSANEKQVYTNAFSRLTSNMFIFSFHFE